MDDGMGRCHGGVSICFFVICLLLSGCGVSTLFNNLEEQEVNEMIAILKQHGIASNKIIGKESCALTVSNDNFSVAINLLESQGYPLPKYQTLGDVFKKSGLVSSPLEERIRFMNALSESIALTISKIPGVLKSRVHIVLPENDPYAEHVIPSSAAVFITYRPDSSVEDWVREIKFLVTNSIEGLDFDKVSVALFPVTLPPLPKASRQTDTMFSCIGIDMTDGSKTQFFMLIGALLAIILVLVLSNTLIWLSVKRKKKEKEVSVDNLAEVSDMTPSSAIGMNENKEESLD
ncbi:MAG: type III secretion inner membrane ring lipoprotein SctJ [Puniceicoccales bacterium]|jgi:type III secretion protein J|nr:type III secretion inner membrane ring lipoprotein SctJ [Puniceicoccales bacterium]